MIKIAADLHNHSSLCDGHSSPKEMVEAAIASGFSDFGISAHGYTPFDLAASIKDEDEYIQIMRRLREEYTGKIRLYCGMEQDFHSPVANRDQYDYLIGSVHYFYDCQEDRYFAVDGDAEHFASCLAEVYGGDIYAMIGNYYHNLLESTFTYRPDIIGHFDLIIKNNADGRFFDEDDKRYRNAAMEALVACLETEAVIELNTGAVFRGFRPEFYPSRFLLQEMKRRKARITLSADAHCIEAVGFAFEEALLLLRETGFNSVMVWQDSRYIEQGIK
jgi:histidinol-phosphatase (PHP family)